MPDILFEDYFSTKKKIIEEREVSCVDVTNNFLKRIKENKHLNIFIESFNEYALEQAKKIDDKIKLKKQGVLAGMVVAVKDNICIKGKKVSAASKILENFTSVYHATVIERILKEDAILIGRVNCDEFAMGSSNETSYYGPVKNPIDQTRVSGGSSGGSASAVKANLCHLALGSDTGGSIRQPSSFCDVLGFKPTYGTISRHGLIAFASSFDQIGFSAKSIEDIRMIMGVVSGPDNYDTTLYNQKIKFSTKKKVTNKPKLVYFKEFIQQKNIDSQIKKDFEKKIALLKKQDYKVEAIDFPYFEQLLPVYYILSTAEASSNLSRYDGVRFGYRAENIKNLEELYVKTRSEGFGKEVKRRILTGTYVLSHAYYEAYYLKAQKVRRLLKDYINKLFENYNFIISPTSPSVPFKIGQKDRDSIDLYSEDIYTVLSNITGIPSISLPLYKSNKGLPCGFQVMSPTLTDDKLLNFSEQLISIF